jgi:DNA replication factor GINS
MGGDINITYETLFEILRLEKSRVELQKLEPGFYSKVSVYLKDKQTMLSKVEPSNTNEIELQAKQISNIKKIVRDIYFRRIKKIINSAMSILVAPNSVVDMDTMLKSEKQFYDNMIGILDSGKKDVLDCVLAAKEVSCDNIIEKQSENMMVRFIQDVPKFIGEDLEEYGPYTIEDVANIPRQLGQILINKGSAEAMDD